MKTLLFFLLIFAFLIPNATAQQNEPVYFYGFYGYFVGQYVCEFAINGLTDSIQDIKPLIHNGRLYFLTPALAISTGNLRPGFEFNLDFDNIDKPRIKAIYRGQARDPVPSKTNKEENIMIAGYAERGSIIVTNVFFDEQKLEEWATTVRFSFE